MRRRPGHRGGTTGRGRRGTLESCPPGAEASSSALLSGKPRNYDQAVKQFATVRVSQAAAKYGEHAPLATTCCNACRTCVQTNLIGIALGAFTAAGIAVRQRFVKYNNGYVRFRLIAHVRLRSDGPAPNGDFGGR